MIGDDCGMSSGSACVRTMLPACTSRTTNSAWGTCSSPGYAYRWVRRSGAPPSAGLASTRWVRRTPRSSVRCASTFVESGDQATAGGRCGRPNLRSRVPLLVQSGPEPYR